ncbi:hypothetical protein EV401DRAFT_441603 [Pisolithus croceorrhizus]|nr:hypothetical protein EV401DRAFT_441603 [Pisolithus croceorrhizus]
MYGVALLVVTLRDFAQGTNTPREGDGGNPFEGGIGHMSLATRLTLPIRESKTCLATSFRSINLISSPNRHQFPSLSPPFSSIASDRAGGVITK